MNKKIQIRTLFCSGLANYLNISIIVIGISGCSISKERPSPFQEDSLQVGSNLLKISYSSPRVRGRSIFGTGDEYLVPFNKVWRTGANEATIFSNSKDILIDTFPLAKGRYSLFTIPKKKSWEIILNKEWNQWGSYYRKDSLDVVRLTLPVKYVDKIQENMQLSFSENSLEFKWEYVEWSIPINLNE